MKKFFTFVSAIVLFIAFTACGGGKKTEAPAEAPVKTEVVEEAVVTEPAAPALPPAEMLKEFQAFAKAYGEAYNNKVKDPKKYAEMIKLYQKQVSDMEKIKGELNAKQAQDYQKALKIIIDANTGGK